MLSRIAVLADPDADQRDKNDQRQRAIHHKQELDRDVRFGSKAVIPGGFQVSRIEVAFRSHMTRLVTSLAG
jgi:hypothetical protein